MKECEEPGHPFSRRHEQKMAALFDYARRMETLEATAAVGRSEVEAGDVELPAEEVTEIMADYLIATEMAEAGEEELSAEKRATIKTLVAEELMPDQATVASEDIREAIEQVTREAAGEVLLSAYKTRKANAGRAAIKNGKRLAGKFVAAAAVLLVFCTCVMLSSSNSLDAEAVPCISLERFEEFLSNCIRVTWGSNQKEPTGLVVLELEDGWNGYEEVERFVGKNSYHILYKNGEQGIVLTGDIVVAGTTIKNDCDNVCIKVIHGVNCYFMEKGTYIECLIQGNHYRLQGNISEKELVDFFETLLRKNQISIRRCI